MTNQEQRILQSIDKEKMMEHLWVLVRKPRLSGTPEELEAFEFIQAQLSSLGIETRLLTFRAYLSWPRFGQVEVLGASARLLEAKTRSYSVSTDEAGVCGELVYIPGGTNMFTDTQTAERLQGMDLRGKVVLTEGGGRQNMALAQKAGAVGYIHMWPTPDPLVHDSTVSPVWGQPTPETLSQIPDIPVVAITNMDGRALLSEMETGPVRVCLRTRTETGWRDQRILECRIPGKTDQFTMIGAHVDTWDIGATDNLTGVCLAMELARVFFEHRAFLERGLRVCFWCGHSPGRYRLHLVLRQSLAGAETALCRLSEY